jgi:uncharacterized protein (TIGR02145 family)
LKSGNATFQIFDLTGKVLIQQQYYLVKGINSYKISGLGNGVYTVKIQTEDSYYVGKIVSRGSKGNLHISSNEKSADNQYAGTTRLKSAVSTISMKYTTGDRLKLTGKSGKYSTVITGVVTENTTFTFSFVDCTDGDGNNYPVVAIGNQIWMEENLRTTKLNDGTGIGHIGGGNDWKPYIVPLYCWYDNDSINNKKTYGALYNWYTVNTAKLCPTGWHVPSDGEWTALEIFLENNGYNYDGTIDTDTLRETNNLINKSLGSTTSDWRSRSDEGAIGNTGYPAYRNKSGFSALPGGYLLHYLSEESFLNITNVAQFWSSSMSNNGYSVWSRELNYNTNYVVRSLDTQEEGLSVRCLKDE